MKYKVYIIYFILELYFLMLQGKYKGGKWVLADTGLGTNWCVFWPLMPIS